MRSLITLCLFFFLSTSVSIYSQTIFSIDEKTAGYGEIVCLDVTVQGFTNIVSMQYSINFDAGLLTYLYSQDYNLPNFSPNNNIGNPSVGNITVAWLSDDVVNGTTVSDGTTIFSLCFEVELASTGIVPVTLSGNPVQVEISDSGGNLIDPVFVDGAVVVSGGASTDVVTPYAPTDTVMAGEQFVVPIRVKNFTDILSFQFSMHYDDDVLEFVELGGFSLPYMGSNTFGYPPNLSDGVITAAWYDEELISHSLNDGDTLFTITFQAIGNPGETSPILFSGVPTIIEFGNAAGAVLPFDFISGNITIFQEVGTSSLENPAFTYLPLSPNPMQADQSYLSFVLQESTNVRWRIVSTEGQVVFQDEAYLPSGKHHINLNRSQFPSSGTYLIELQTGNYRAVRPLLVH